MITQQREAEVWQRVMAASAQAPDCPPVRERSVSDSQKILELLRQCEANGHTYALWAAKTKGAARTVLAALSSSARHHRRKLSAVYYVLVGRRPHWETPLLPDRSCIHSALRTCYHAELQAADTCDALAKSNPAVCPTFQQLSRENAAHAQQLLTVLEHNL